MKITGLAGITPSNAITNEDVLNRLEKHSKTVFEGDLPKTMRIVDKLLSKTGISSRYWFSAEESPMALMKQAFNQALVQANIEKEQIDLLLYSSVSRGFTEPANSVFIAKALGLTCRNFDVTDACMGWVSSMDLVNDKMCSGTVQYAAIVNMELASLDTGLGRAQTWALKSADELPYKFPTYTIGDAITVTILSNESPENFRFTFINRPQFGELCTISLPGWEAFCNQEDIEYIAPTGGRYEFCSYGKQLHDLLEIEMINVFNQHNISSEIEIAFTHTSSPERWKQFCQMVGIEDKLHPIGHRTGNVVTASVPLAIADAINCGKLKKGQNCLSWVGAAGMSFSAMTFTY